MKTNILAPFIKVEESFNFYVNGRAFEMKDNNLNLIESFGSELRNSIAAFESFEFGSNSIKWFHGPSKFVFDINENKFKHNDSLIEGNTFTNHVLSAGMVRYNEKPKAELFESLPTLLENFIVLDFAATFEGNNNIVDVFKLDEKVYVSRFNTENRIANFFLAENANAAVDYVTEKTGENALSFLSELVEGQAKELAEKEAKIAECNDMIAFLKDQRGLLAEADKSIPEIKAADVLINEEIANWEAKIVELSTVTEAKAWDKLNKIADEVHGEFGFATLDSDTMSKYIDMKKADKLADKMFGEFGFDALGESEMEELINKNPKLVKESVNESSMEIKKLEDAIKMFQDKIKKQGRITNARDEEHLSALIKAYKQMGGSKIKESVNEGRADGGKMARTHVVYALRIQEPDGAYLASYRVAVKKGPNAEERAKELAKKDLGKKLGSIKGISKALNPELHDVAE